MKTVEIFGSEMDKEEILDRLDVLWQMMPDDDSARNAAWDEITALEDGLKSLEADE